MDRSDRRAARAGVGAAAASIGFVGFGLALDGPAEAAFMLACAWAAAALLISAAIAIARADRSCPPSCAACGYDLHDVAEHEPTCPECGHRGPLATRRPIARGRLLLVALLVVVALGFATTGFGLVLLLDPAVWAI